MNETMKKLTEETRTALVASITSKAVLDLFATTKAASDDDSGSFNVIVSTADTDRQGDSVSQDGWDLSYFKSNPVVLWAHDYGSLPIGMCTSIEVKDGKLVAAGKFAPADANPFAQQVRRLYELGMVRATSVGFIPTDTDYSREPVKINKAELLEFSFVPVPANPHALTLDQIKKLKIDTTMLKTKGIEVSVKDGEPAPETVTPPVETTPTTETPAPAATEAQPAVETTTPPTPPVETEKKPDEVVPEPVTPVEDLKSLHTKLDRITVALEKHGLLEGAVAGKETPAATTRSRSSEDTLKELNQFVQTRELLRSIDISIEKVLRNFNDAARLKR